MGDPESCDCHVSASLISGYLIARLGHTRIMLAGLALYSLTLALALAGRDLLNYWSALVMLGVGWNFLFVAGTSLLPGCYRPKRDSLCSLSTILWYLALKHWRLWGPAGSFISSAGNCCW